jgi:hypothetical protein
VTNPKHAPIEGVGPNRATRRRARRGQMTAVAGLGLLGAVAAPWTFAAAAHATPAPGAPGALTLSDVAGTALAGAPYGITLVATDTSATADRAVVLDDALPPDLSYQAGSTLPGS